MTDIILTKDEIIHLAKLTSLSLSKKEISRFQKQLSETLEYVNNLQELDTENVKTTDHTVNSRNVYFEDGKKNVRGLNLDEALKNAKRKKNNYFVVKRIL